jgi:hypothetical protein
MTNGSLISRESYLSFPHSLFVPFQHTNIGPRVPGCKFLSAERVWYESKQLWMKFHSLLCFMHYVIYALNMSILLKTCLVTFIGAGILEMHQPSLLSTNADIYTYIGWSYLKHNWNFNLHFCSKLQLWMVSLDEKIVRQLSQTSRI